MGDRRAVSYGRRVSWHAARHPHQAAFVFVGGSGERTVTWRELEDASNRAARLLAEEGLGQGSMLAVVAPNSVEHVVATIAGWKLGACVLPLRWDLPAWERERVLEVAAPDVIVGHPGPDGDRSRAVPVVSPRELADAAGPSAPLPDRVADPVWAIATSGSTGTPKVIVRNQPGAAAPGEGTGPAGAYLGHRPGQVQLVPAPMYHANGLYSFHWGLFEGQRLVLMERFDAATALDLIERQRVNTFCGVTIMFQRMARTPDVGARDLSSLQSVLQGGAALPEWVARKWIDLVGPDRFFVSSGSSENAGTAMARGDEWLAHPGTIGRP